MPSGVASNENYVSRVNFLIEQLLEATKQKYFTQAEEILQQIEDEDGLQMDQLEHAAIQCAARKEGGNVLLQMLDKFKSKLKPGEKALRNAVENQTADFCAEMGNCSEPEQWGTVGDEDGDTSLHSIARANHLPQDAFVKMILIVGVERFYKKNHRQETPLHWLAECQSADTIVQLAEKLDREKWKTVDKDGDTPLHYSARNEKDSETLFKILDIMGGNVESLYENNKKNQTPLHFAAEYQSGDTIADLIAKYSVDNKQWKIADKDGNTPLHFSARNECHSDTLFKIVELVGIDFLQKLNKRQETPLHYVAMYQSAETIEKLATHGQAIKWKVVTEDGETALHYSAKNQNHADTLLKIVERMGTECLYEKNNKCQTPLHFIAECQSADTVTKLNVAAKEWSLADEDGNTPLHFSARNKIQSETFFKILDILDVESLFKKNNKQQTPLHFASNITAVKKAADSCGFSERDIILWQDTDHRNMMFHACMYKQIDFIYKFLQFVPPWQCIDSEGNTALHALFWDTELSFCTRKYLEIFKMLVTAGFGCSAENVFKQNCLHACSLWWPLLEGILEAEPDSFKPMLTNSLGMHTVHAFSGRYDLIHILKPLAEVSATPEKSLLQLTVSKGNFRGATCLHFACEAGHSKNIKFLISRGLRPSATTHSGQSCIDFAFDKGKIAAVIDAATENKMTLLDILRLVDVAKRALKLPERSAAQQQLVSFTDAPVRSDAKKDAAQSPQVGLGVDNEQQKLSAQANNEDRTDLKILLRAVELDSTLIIRSLLSLDMLQPETAAQFPSFLAKKLQSSDSIPMGKFQGWENFVALIYESRKKISNASESNSIQMEKHLEYSVSLIEIGVHFEKLDIIPDLLLIRQFDLIPTCIDLLLQLQPMVAQKRERHEQLTELQSKVVSVVVNALDELFINADSEQKRLLFRFLKGEMPHSEEGCDASGPRFRRSGMVGASGRAGREEISVLQMVEELNSDDVFATECLHQLAKDEWNRGADAQCTVSSCFHRLFQPRIKFWVNSAALIVFLMYFAWFITDFIRTFESLVPVLILLSYALSYTTQEANDFRRMCNRKRSYFNIFGSAHSVPLYFGDVLNCCDCLSLLFMWIGIAWHVIIFTQGVSHTPALTIYRCQMMLTTSFLLWGFRSVGVLSFYEIIGPVISMLRKLLIRDLVPFMAILLVIMYYFGVFFFNLLFPITTASAADTNSPYYFVNVLQQMLSLPTFLLFGLFERSSFHESNRTNQKIGNSANPDGLKWFNAVFVFVFLMVVNIVMMNLLIALFNLTVSSMMGKATSIWRKKYFDMLREYESLSIVPPPLSFPFYIWRCVNYGYHVLLTNTLADDDKCWWRREDTYCQSEEFVKFLQYQAFQLRRVRPLLTRGVTSNRGEFEQLRASTENSLAAMQREMNDSWEGMLEQHSDKLERQLSEMKEKLDLLLSKLKC